MRTRTAIISACVAAVLCACSSDSKGDTGATVPQASSTIPVETIIIIDTTSIPSTVPIGTVWAPSLDAPDDLSLFALISGTLRYDPINECYLLRNADNGSMFLIVWPAGTVALTGVPGVATVDGLTFREGDRLRGGGGFLQVSDEWDIPDACRSATGEVTVFNARGALEDPTIKQPPPIVSTTTGPTTTG